MCLSKDMSLCCQNIILLVRYELVQANYINGNIDSGIHFFYNCFLAFCLFWKDLNKLYFSEDEVSGWFIYLWQNKAIKSDSLSDVCQWSVALDILWRYCNFDQLGTGSPEQRATYHKLLCLYKNLDLPPNLPCIVWFSLTGDASRRRYKRSG